MFFVRAPVESGQSYGEVLGSYGLTQQQQIDALQLRGNTPLRRGWSSGQMRTMLNSRSVRSTTMIVPVDLRLSLTEFQPVIDLVVGLRPRRPHEIASGPPTLTHGVSIKVERNLGQGTSLKWIQTVQKQNNPDPDAPPEFVDGGGNDEPFYYGRRVAPPLFTDVPCGPVAQQQGTGVNFDAMTTLSVLVGRHIILASGLVWGFTINADNSLPAGVTARRPRNARGRDFRNQLRILRLGVNQYNDPTGPDLGYRMPPARGRVAP